MAIQVKENGYGKGKIIIIILVILLAAGMIGGGILLSDSMGVAISENTHTEIKSGAGSASIAQQLKAEGIIKYPLLFRLQSKIGGYDGNYQPGSATVSVGMSYDDILKLLSTPGRETTKVVIPEGYEIRQIIDKLLEAGLIDEEAFRAELDPSKYNYKFLEGLPQRENALEGYLFPATYEIPNDLSEHDIIDLMLSAFNNQFKPEYYDRAKELGMTVDQIVTLASVIERETDKDSERAKVAGVFYNRIHSGMKLQSCATIQYILKERKPALSIADTKLSSPYNTYQNAGLPVGPIASPGLSCIQAALYPEQTDALYFVLGKDGSHVFSKTYEEHLAAKAQTEAVVTVDDAALAQ